MKEADISKWAKRHNLDRFPSELRSMISDALDLFGDSEQETVQNPVGYVAENGVVDWNVCAPPILTDLYTTPSAQPAVPDALNPKDENPAYAAGWNDCRAEMLKGMKP